MTLTSCIFWKPQTDKIQILNTLLHQMNLEPTAVGKTKRKVRINEITADTIQRKLLN